MVSNRARYATPHEAATPCSSCNTNPAFLREFRFKGLDWASVANQTQEMPLYVRPGCFFRLVLAASRAFGVWCVLVRTAVCRKLTRRTTCGILRSRRVTSWHARDCLSRSSLTRQKQRCLKHSKPHAALSAARKYRACRSCLAAVYFPEENKGGQRKRL